MSTASSRTRRPVLPRSAAVVLLLSAFVLLVGLLGAGGAPAHASAPAGTATGGSDTSDYRATGVDEDVSPHADNDEELTGRDLSPGRLAFIITVASVTVVIIVALVFRGRRKRAVGQGDLQ